MSQTSDRLREYLVPEESLRGVYAATLSDNSAPKEVSVGVTDRRVLCLSDDGTFLNVGYDSICAVRSHPRSTLTYRGNDARLLLGGGVLLAALGFVALVAFTTGLATPALALVTFAALAATISLYRRADDATPVTLDDVERRAPADLDVDVLRRIAGALPENADGDRILLSLSVLLTGMAAVGTVAVAATPLVVLFFVPILAGVGLVEYARTHASDFDGIEIARERVLNVRISTEDGQTVRLEVDPAADIDRELSRLAFVDADEPVQHISARS